MSELYEANRDDCDDDFDGEEVVPIPVSAGTISTPVTDAMYRAGRGEVVALREKGTGHEHALPRTSRITIGSRGGCDLVIDDVCVSGLHCWIERRADALFVRDRQSKNGTFVNGHAVDGAELRPGSVLTIGRTSMIALAEAGRGKPTAFEQLRGTDPRFRAAVETAVKAGASDCSVFVVGETGTGKELIARVVHESSTRSSTGFVALNCGAIPRELIGSELFGHERGAFTGATGDRDGCFVSADGGTLFLDELGELPIEMQPHLLRVLETRRVRRVGGENERNFDVRVVAATNRLAGLGTPSSAIRLDLYHRLATVVVYLPPLRERMRDLDEIVRAVLDELAPQYGRRRVTPVAWDAMRAYAWPGNVRELRQALLRAVTLGGEEISVEHLFPSMVSPMPSSRSRSRSRSVPPPSASGASFAAEQGLALPPIDQAQAELMADAIARSRSIRSAAQLVGMPKSTFAEKGRRWGLLPIRTDEDERGGDPDPQRRGGGRKRRR